MLDRRRQIEYDVVSVHYLGARGTNLQLFFGYAVCDRHESVIKKNV